MPYEQRDNSGSLFKNDRKEKESQPDRTGTAMIDGVMYYVSGWIKVGTRGQFLSLAFKRKDAEALVGGRMVTAGEPNPSQSISQRAQATIKRPDPVSSGRHDMDDEIPF